MHRPTHPERLSLGEIEQPFALLVVVDQESGVDEKEPVLECLVEGSLFEENAFLHGMREIESECSFSSSRSHNRSIPGQEIKRWCQVDNDIHRDLSHLYTTRATLALLKYK